jgi:acyl-CoA synthetase (AMP-forming)/AMP-acid ligase II
MIFNDTMQAPWLDSLAQYLAHYAVARPDTEAVVCGARRYTYAQLAEQVDLYAAAMLGAGIRPGQRVATLAPPSAEFLLTFLAATSIGAIWCGLNPKHTLREMAHVLADAQPVLLFTRARIDGRDLLPLVQELCDGAPHALQVVLLDDIAAPCGMQSLSTFLVPAATVSPEVLASVRVAVPGSVPALLVYTSGTTGTPKGAMLPQRGLAYCSRVAVEHYGVPRIRILNNLPINHIGCVGDICGYALAGGGTIVFTPQFNAEGSLRLIEQEGITVWAQVPTMFQLSLGCGALEQYDLSSLGLIMWSGAAAPASLVALLATLAPRLVTCYGTTETLGSVTYTEFDAALSVLAATIGKPCPRYKLRLADGEGREVRPGEPGEIQLSGEVHMSGYLNRPEDSVAVRTPDGWLRTGDIARADVDGNWRLVGRLKEMFKSGGYNIYPREIELALEAWPGVEAAAVVSVPDPLFGEVGHAFVVCRDSTVDAAALQAHCRVQLANYKVPKQFHIRSELPMLPIGKIDKRALREQVLYEAGKVVQ